MRSSAKAKLAATLLKHPDSEPSDFAKQKPDAEISTSFSRISGE